MRHLEHSVRPREIMKSWFNPKTEKRASSVAGVGLFARERILSGELVAVKAGAVLHRQEFNLIKSSITPAEIQIDDDLFITPLRPEEVEENMLRLNHSCDPNVGVRGQITFVAMQDIPAGSELTIDYAMIDGDQDESMDCACSAERCRKTITGNDWRKPELQERYAGYFSQYLDERISQVKKAL